jgi:hypothetical protein
MTRTPLNDDILRGLRGGAILLAVLAIGIGGYRLMRESPPPPDPPASDASLPPHADGAPVEKSADRPTVPVAGSSSIPPPPPARIKAVRENAARRASTENAATVEPISNHEDTPAVSDEKASAPAPESHAEKGVDRSAEKASDPGESGDLSSGPASIENVKPEGRSKRWIKAVGRWLGIGKKPAGPAGPDLDNL